MSKRRNICTQLLYNYQKKTKNVCACRNSRAEFEKKISTKSRMYVRAKLSK